MGLFYVYFQQYVELTHIFYYQILMTENVRLNPRQKDLSVYPDISYCMLTDKNSFLYVSKLLLLLLLLTLLLLLCFNKFPIVQYVLGPGIA